MWPPTLVVAADASALERSLDELFPGHRYAPIQDPRSNTTVADRILRELRELALQRPNVGDRVSRLGALSAKHITKNLQRAKHAKPS